MSANLRITKEEIITKYSSRLPYITKTWSFRVILDNLDKLTTKHLEHLVSVLDKRFEAVPIAAYNKKGVMNLRHAVGYPVSQLKLIVRYLKKQKVDFKNPEKQNRKEFRKRLKELQNLSK